MKIFGRVSANHDAEGLVTLSEVTFQASPDEVREVAAFLLRAADEMEQADGRFSHAHLQDAVPGWKEHRPRRPDVIVSA